MQQRIFSFATSESERCKQYGVLLAVSGGADSTAMLRCFAETAEKTKIAVAHINHGLRGAESDADAAFVREMSERYGLRYFEYRIKPADWQQDASGSVESAARTIRYQFLTATAEQLGFRYAATAHTADDQTETVLHRIFRGTGLSGLAGIRPFRQLSPAITLIRPLLNVSRAEIFDYLQMYNVPYRTDSSNLSNDFTRNKIRNRILPLIRQEGHPNVDAAVRRLAHLAAAHETVLDELLGNTLQQMIIRRTENEIILDRNVIEKQSVEVLRELLVRLWKQEQLPLREMGQQQWEQLAAFVRSSEKTLEVRSGMRIEKDGSFLRLNFRN
jgi:tRNA(Ile)-lysidine synthase